ncbi:integrase [Lichenibacterium minor]|uniref:Integrase n=1 Tax=Lichenibacterium minor TaxID=2316528 RepID=A0A4V1RU41_9HYPH|nr:DUF6538 domain-containing protein [Lichenibacterium minor]RYC29834.1 integrase [Lichenibacterium minor]
MAFVILRHGAMTVTMQHLFIRPRDGLLFYRRRVPTDVAAHFPGKTVRMVSLQTRDLLTAGKKLARLVATDDALWRSLRSPEASALGLTTEEVQAAGEALLRKLGMVPGGAYFDAMAHEGTRNPDLWDAFAHHLDVKHGAGPYKGVEGDRAAVMDPVDREAERLFKENPRKPRVLLSDARDLYLKHNTKGSTPKLKADTTRAVAALIAFRGDLPLEAYARQDALDLRDHLLAEGKNPNTVRRQLSPLLSVFKTAIDEHFLDIRNPFGSVKIASEDRDTLKRVPYTSDELCIIAKACRERGDDIRSIIALLSDTGARVAEIVGLRFEDVVMAAPAPFIHIREHGTVRTLKNANSVRRVPLVGEALWAAQRALEASGKVKDGKGWLWPRYASDVEIKATHASGAFNKWLRTLPGVSPDKTCHCFRHAMRDRLRVAHVPGDMQDAIGGWGEKTTGAKYGEGYKPETLAPYMAKIVAPPDAAS